MHTKLKIAEIHLGWIIGKDHSPTMIDTVILPVDDKGMEMGVGPAHDELQNVMEIGDGAVAAATKRRQIMGLIPRNHTRN